MKFLHRLIPLLIIILFVGNIFILLGFSEWGSLAGFIGQYRFPSALFLLLELPFVYFVIYKAYIKPVQDLNRNISRFMTGIDENPDLQPDTWSHGMNNVIAFFIKSLQILSVFKQELRDGRKLRSEVEIASEIQKDSIA